jgi:hypothetical protein
MAEPVYAALQARGALAGVGFSNSAGVRVDRFSRNYGYRVVGRLESSLVWLGTPRQEAEPLVFVDKLPQDLIEVPAPARPAIRFLADRKGLFHRYLSHPFRSYRYGIWRDAHGAIAGITIDRPVRLLGVTGASLLSAYARDVPALMRCWTTAVRRSGARFVRVLATPRADALAALRTLGVAVRLRPRFAHYLTVKLLEPPSVSSEMQAAGAQLLDFARWDCLGGEVL